MKTWMRIGSNLYKAKVEKQRPSARPEHLVVLFFSSLEPPSSAAPPPPMPPRTCGALVKTRARHAWFIAPTPPSTTSLSTVSLAFAGRVCGCRFGVGDDREGDRETCGGGGDERLAEGQGGIGVWNGTAGPTQAGATQVPALQLKNR